MNKDSFTPPKEVRDAAKRGLELREKHNRGGTAVGVARARDLSNGKGIPIETINRMLSYFARHEVDKKGEGWGVDSAGYIAWLLWGGDAGRAWATRIKNDYEKKEKANMAELAHSYAAITKSEKQEDGTLKVYGKATDDSLDIDSQICDPTWLKDAMPDWFTSGGNIREQHSNIAAGVATDYEEKADGHYITALVVDPVSVKKVETGVLKGFSIGIRGPRVVRDDKAANGRIIDGQIVEVSLVDRPANPNAKLMLAKAAESGELMAVEQKGVPTPAEVFASLNKSDDAEVEAPAETPEAEEVLVENVPADQPAEAELLNTAKSFLATLNKFDQATYDAARIALSELIVVEAKEMATDGHSEKESIEELLDSVKHLFRWYEGEVANGEVANPVVEHEIVPDSEATEILLSADGEDVPAEGDSMDDKMCDKCGEAMKLCKCDKSDDEVAAEKSADLDETIVNSILEKAITSAKASVMAELEILKSAKEAAEQELESTKASLADALTKTVAGGPSRLAKAASDETKTNDLLQKAAAYRVKADSTTDRQLAEGYMEIAADLEAKALKNGKVLD
jgi:hypothetical protein